MSYLEIQQLHGTSRRQWRRLVPYNCCISRYDSKAFKLPDFHFHWLIPRIHRHGGCIIIGRWCLLSAGTWSHLCFGVHVCVSNISESCQCLNDLRVRIYNLGTLTTWLLNQKLYTWNAWADRYDRQLKQFNFQRWRSPIWLPGQNNRSIKSTEFMTSKFAVIQSYTLAILLPRLVLFLPSINQI